ncbi:ABC transporter substrate-binding protein [Salicibibacter halophilus]|uniref:ABC transporter substrate-binding protein n=1 Tax=Salicibibacter halophilus TaxID=2502791 RepID=A0A514LJK7_9BACI|nr:ABC transporter substrate-binding protein [Salicibibacter halophilus]QDI92037.1 ABC transporter substrate-binding protein [Salicibibacter halophilus]
MRRTRTISVILFLTTAIILAGCGQREPAEDDVIKIGYLPITHASPLYFMNEFEDEYLDGAEVELVQFGDWIDLMDALNSGRIDGASVLFQLAMKANELEIDLKATALGHQDGNAIIAGHNIDSANDLEGETVAIPHTLSSHNILLDEMLQAEGMEYGDVNVVELPPAEMPAALGEGRVEAYVVAEPFGALGVTLDAGHVLHQSHEHWPNSLCCALVLREDLIDEKPELANQFMRGYGEAGKHADHDHEESFAVHQHYMDIDEEALALSLDWISYDNLEIPRDDFNYLRQRLVDLDLSDDPPTYEEFVDPSFFEEL